MSLTTQQPNFSSYVILLSGTHVAGKESLAISLSKSLNCPWIKAEMAHNSATLGARSQSKKGYSYDSVFRRIWCSKLLRLGLLSDGNESDGEGEVESPRKSAPRKSGCMVVISCYAMRKPARDAIRNVMVTNGIRSIFAITHITKETLLGRTLGAEEPDLAERIMGEKIADIQEPMDEERDVLLIDSLKDLDDMFLQVMGGISELLAESSLLIDDSKRNSR
jgi:gluconate kinase